MELDIETQTVCSTTPCLVFEGVPSHDVNYSLAYASGFLLLVYPTQMISVYQDNGYFARRIEDPQCRGLDFYDANLVPAAHGDGASGSGLDLKHVVQSQVRILVPILQGTNLVFVSRRPTN